MKIFRKCINDKIMVQTIDYLYEKKQKIVITASLDKKELEKVERIISYCKHKLINLSRKLSLKEVVYFLSKSKLYIGVDAAIMRIAAAVDTPVVAFFGPSGALIGDIGVVACLKAATQKRGFRQCGNRQLYSITGLYFMRKDEKLVIV